MQRKIHVKIRWRPAVLLPFYLLFAALAGGCLNRSDDTDRAGSAVPAGDRRPISRVVVAEARMVNWPRTFRIQGSLLCDQRVIVGAKVAGRIKSLGSGADQNPVDLGSEVREGDVLARLETEELKLRVEQAESQLEQVRAVLGLDKSADESNYDPSKAPSVVQEKALWDAARDNWDRAKALELETAITAEEVQQRKSLVDVAAARYESALYGVAESIALLGARRAELGLARQALKDAEIRAPFAGVVEQRYVVPGAYVQVGDPVVALVKVNPWRFRASVPEREAAAVRLGQRVSIHIEGEPRPLEAVVARISPSVEASNRSLTVEAVEHAASESPGQAGPGGPEPQLRRGLFAEADIHVDPDARTLAVPRAAVREFAGVEKVWRVSGGEAAEQPVEMGRQSDESVEILGGLSVGDVVVVEDIPKQAGPVEVTKRL